jgi:hypothetical protein
MPAGASVFPNLLKNPISVFHFSFDILLQVAQPSGYHGKKKEKNIVCRIDLCMLRIMHLEHGISEISGPCLHLRGA